MIEYGDQDGDGEAEEEYYDEQDDDYSNNVA